MCCAGGEQKFVLKYRDLPEECSKGCFTSERNVEEDSRSCYCCTWCSIVEKISTDHLSCVHSCNSNNHLLITAVVRITNLINLQ